MKKSNTPPIINGILFYVIAFFTGIVVLPATGGVGFALLLCSVICPIGGVVKLIGSVLGYQVPISLFDIGGFHIPLVLGFILSIVLGIAMFIAGRVLWNVTRKYLVWIGEMKRNMMINQNP